MPLIRSASFNLCIEILLRIVLFTAFCYMETMTPYSRFIHKSDLESEYKYPRKDSFVPSETLWTVVLSVPCILSVLAWAIFNDCNDAFEILLAWSLALGINGFLTDMIKLIAGRPRPDFFYRCFPDGVPIYSADELQCTGDAASISDGRKSFPSGHSSLSFCSLGLASAWICGRLGVLSRRRGSGPRMLVALAPLVGAACIAMSRSCDYHHHWEDILVGSAIGFTLAIFCYRQYYFPLSSDMSGVPYIIVTSVTTTNKFSNGHGKPDISPVKLDKESENAPLLGSKKEDKWI